MKKSFRSLPFLSALIMATSSIPAGAQSQDKAAIHSVVMRQADSWNRHDASRLTITEVHVRFLAPRTALAHARWSMVGAKTLTGIPEPREGIQTLVLTKQGGPWLIAGFQNTHSIPERPFPSGPGTGAKP